MKEKNTIKFVNIVLLLLLFISVTLVYFLYNRYYKSDFDFCLDTGCCKEGLIVNTEYGKIEINKQNCQQYDWNWDEEFRRCQLK